MNLTDRQEQLIIDLLETYEGYRIYFEEDYGKHETKSFIFKDVIYIVLKCDYKNVCEIIDYIKGVKKDGI
jgi:hypothetical protein